MAHAPAPGLCYANLCKSTHLAYKTGPKHQKMAHECQRSTLVKSAKRSSSSTSSCCWRAALSSILAAPGFLGYTPPRHPISEPGIAIVWRRGGSHRGTPTCSLTGATLAMNPAAPLLFRHTPSCLPISESVSTVVWVCRSWWHCWHHWRQDRHDWLGWRCRGWASAVVHSATPRFFVSCPGVFVTHSAIEWVHWTNRNWASRWQCVRGCVRWCGWRRRRWCRRRCGWWRRERSGRNRHWWLWQSCGGPCSGAAPTHGTAAEILLCLGPSCFPHRESLITIVWE